MHICSTIIESDRTVAHPFNHPDGISSFSKSYGESHNLLIVTERKPLMGKNEICCDCDVIHGETVDYVRSEIVNDNKLTEMSKFFKVFGDSTRINILAALNCHEMCVCDLAVLLDMTKSAVSHQLRVLRNNNLVKFYKKGKHAYYSLADDHVKEILDVALEHINE